MIILVLLIAKGTRVSLFAEMGNARYQSK